jgi:hypothetical protein
VGGQRQGDDRIVPPERVEDVTGVVQVWVQVWVRMEKRDGLGPRPRRPRGAAALASGRALGLDPPRLAGTVTGTGTGTVAMAMTMDVGGTSTGTSTGTGTKTGTRTNPDLWMQSGLGMSFQAGLGGHRSSRCSLCRVPGMSRCQWLLPTRGLLRQAAEEQ